MKPNDTVLLVGSGLTAVDMMSRLDATGHIGRIHSISRRGLRLHRHYDCGPDMVPLGVPLLPSLTILLRLVRTHALDKGWREAIDGLRPSVQRLWCDASDVERKRFLRHLRPWWDIHRHRLARAVADRVQALQDEGRLAFHAGRIHDVRFEASRAETTWIQRGTQTSQTLTVDRIINCTGPAGDLTKTTSPLLQDLFSKGLARPDTYGLGLDVDADCRIIDARGAVQERLHAIGPISRGAFWEITAAPDIHVQVARVATLLS